MKNTYYFSHDANARNDPKILALRNAFGWEGYGIFWAIVELMREQNDYKLPYSDAYIAGYAIALNYDASKLREFIDFCIELHLFERDETHFWSPSLLRRMEKMEEENAKRSEIARKAAAKRWQSQEDAKAMPEQCISNADALHEQCESNAEAMHMHMHKQCDSMLKKRKEKKRKENVSNIAFSSLELANANSQEENVSPQVCGDSPSSTDVNDVEIDSKSSKSERVPYQKIVEIYHEECPDLPRVKVLNETRKRLLRARWKERPDLEFWREYFRRVHASDFLCGRVEPRNGKPPFLADFEWLIRPNNFAKVIEGKYDNRGSLRKTEPDVEAVLREFGVKEAG